MSVLSALRGAAAAPRYLAATLARVAMVTLDGGDGGICSEAIVRAAAVVLISGAKPGHAKRSLLNGAELLRRIAEDADVEVSDEEVAARAAVPPGTVLQ